jgi:hypothetical protein
MAQQFSDPTRGRNIMQFGVVFPEKGLFGGRVRKCQVFHVYK